MGSDGSSQILPKMVRFLPKTVRLPRQRSTRLENPHVNENGLILSLARDINFWDKFYDYLLQNHSKHTAKVRLLYCKKYYSVLKESDAQELLTLSSGKRIHAMKSLAALSKYLGCYDEWKKIRERFQLKWSDDDDSLQTFKNMTNPNKDYQSMTNWLIGTMSRLPKKYSNILLYNTLTGLRPDEACKSIALIHNSLDEYLNKESFVLEHFKYPEIFSRRTKKAYVSIVTDSILDIAKQSSSCGYNALRLAVKRNGLDMYMGYCRKIFATHLRMNGVEQEIVDLLQGRTPKSVFARYYFRPTNLNHSKIMQSISSLYDFLSPIVKTSAMT